MLRALPSNGCRLQSHRFATGLSATILSSHLRLGLRNTLNTGFQHSHVATFRREMAQNIRISPTEFLIPFANTIRSEAGFL
jgi:hypothetical protein